MTATRPHDTTSDTKFILELRIDASGEVTRKAIKLGRKDTLEGKLLAQLYPGIQVARVSVPAELTPYEQSVVENRMAQLNFGGVEYKLVGASGSAKDGKFYFVDQPFAKPIAERFQHWPEAAIVYFSILISDCKLVIEQPDLRIVDVEDHVLGTNDCRGWIRESLYRKLHLSPDRFCQFRLAFDAREPKQAKGALKAMSDRVADRLAIDVILPESACKPNLKGGSRFLPQIGTSGRLFRGPAVLGIKQWSRVTEYGSSYTLVEHASDACEACTLAHANVRGGEAAMNRREFVGLMGLSAGNFALAQPGVRGSLIGVWTLQSCVRTFPDGHKEYPFGEKPVGRIEYDKESRMFALLMRSGRHSTMAPGLELDAASAEEIRQAVTGFVAYFGSYEVDDASQTVTHHVEASLVPSWVGTSLKRRFRWDGARLVLTRAVPGTTDELVWERA